MIFLVFLKKTYMFSVEKVRKKEYIFKKNLNEEKWSSIKDLQSEVLQIIFDWKMAILEPKT